jgi:hypothetical protein
MNKEIELNYKRNFLLSLLTTAFTLLLILFSFLTILMILRITGQIAMPQEQVTEQVQEEEKRVAVRLKNDPNDQYDLAQNINANQKLSPLTKLLSDANSQSTAPTKADKKTGEIKTNDGNDDNLEIKKNDSKKNDLGEGDKETFVKKSYDEKSVFGTREKETKEKEDSKTKKESQNGASFRDYLSTKSKNSGAENFGSEISLSTYKWNYAPYIQIIRERLYKYISLPPAFNLGLLHGATAVKIVITQEGALRLYKVLDHKGNLILKTTSEDVVQAIFNLPKLPPDFPDKELEIVIIFKYNVR